MRFPHGLSVFGLVMMAIGAYVAGGTTVACTRAGAPAEATDAPPAVQAQCRVEATRWLGRQVVESRTYPLVTSVSRTTESSGSRSSSASTTSWILLFSRAVEVERIAAPHDQVEQSYEAAEKWFAGAAASPLLLDLTQWRFAYGAIGFGALWLCAVSVMTRGLGHRAGRRQRHPR